MIAELLAPTRCAGCDLPGTLLCDECLAQVARYDPTLACPRCAAPFGFLACTECCERELAFDSAFALGELDGPLGRAVVLHKDAGELRLGALLGELTAERSGASQTLPDVVTWVPPTRTALTRRGFDHARAIAEPLADSLGVPCEALLVRPAARDQRRLGRQARLQAAEEAGFVAAACTGVVLAVDDVLTTGATLEAAADALRAAGAERVEVAVVARAW